MQVESLVWLSAGIALGLFIAMAVLALFAAGERRHLRRWRRQPGPAPVDPASASEAKSAPPPQAATVPASTVEAKPSTAPLAAAERPQLDIEGLFEEAFQSSLQPEQERPGR